MRIAVDVRMMGAGKTRGIGRYIDETVNAMRRLAPDIEFVLLDPPIRWYTLAEQVRMPSIIREPKAELLWCPHWNVPLFYRGPLAITVHDLLLLHQPASAKASTRHPLVAWVKKIGQRIVLSHAVRRARAIFVPTQTVADDVAKHFPIAKDRIVVTGEGIDHLPAAHSRFEILNSRFLLYVGSAYPHKRVDLLLDAWEKLAPKYPDLRLVIAGERDVFMQRLEARAKNLSSVEFRGRVSDEELAELLTNAAGFVFPSSFEGFGLPPLEALAAGTPVVSSDIPVLREVLPSEGVFFFKNGDSDDMIRAIETMLSAGPQGRAAARQGGESARRCYCWERVAEKTLAGLKRAVSSSDSTHATS